MRLFQIINKQDFISTFINPFNDNEKAIANSIATNFYLKHKRRLVRESYIDTEDLKDFLTSFVVMNKQKISYIIETSNQDFISTQSSATSTANDTSRGEDLDYNTDYYGGEGTTGKATGTATSTSNVSSSDTYIDNTKKLFNFYSADTNSIFRQLEDKMFETFEVDEDLKW